MMDRLINVLVLITLIEMMIAIGLGVTWSEFRAAARDGRLVARALLANYVCVPALTVALLLLLSAPPMVAAGFLILAVCPGAPFGPPCTGIARGDTAVAVGAMVILAASSALVAPLLLGVLLPILSAGESADGGAALPSIDAMSVVRTLLVTQLIPLGVGLAVRQRWPAVAARLRRPANAVSALLSLIVLGLIVAAQFDTLREIRPRGLAGMLGLLTGSLAVGWLLGGPGLGSRRALALTTSLRNVGVGLVIATAAFPGTAAVTAVIAYGLIEILGSLLLAAAWGRGGLARESFGDRKPPAQTGREEVRQLS